MAHEVPAVKRRQLLAIGGSAVTSSIAGCLDNIPTVGETALGGFWIVNLHTESSHRFDVKIVRNGTVVHRSLHHLAADDDPASDPPQVEVRCTWDRTVGDYTVFVRSDQRKWQRFDPLRGAVRPPECVVVEAHYDDNFGPSDDPPRFTFQVDEDCPGSKCAQS